MTGNLEAKKFTRADVDIAIDAMHYMIKPLPELLNNDLMVYGSSRMELMIDEAHPDTTREEALKWGITIGILAERNRISRNKREDR